MISQMDDAVERFRRRTDETDQAKLRRNLDAGVYGAPGSQRHAIAARALAERQADLAESQQLVRRDETDALVARAEDAERLARRSIWLAAIALVVAAIGLALAIGAL